MWVTVSDDGEVIAPEQLPHIFEPDCVGFSRRRGADLDRGFVSRDRATALRSAVPVMSLVAQVGLLLVAGDPCTPEEVPRLTYLSRFVGRAVRLCLWHNVARDWGQGTGRAEQNAV
ncbi:MAG: hypothetical protein NZM11_06540 [Anaerolineales bacterium]|nr:hypothetical protein [Anaerolineales bacterium]